jgi:hypothetical protein
MNVDVCIKCIFKNLMLFITSTLVAERVSGTRTGSGLETMLQKVRKGSIWMF